MITTLIKHYYIILWLSGSGATTASVSLSFFDQPWWKEHNAAVLIIEKPGITRDVVNSKIFLEQNTLTQRAHDCLMVIDHLRKTEPRWNRKIVLIGYSAGAMVAAYLCPMMTEVKAVAMLSGGCGMSLRDELLLLEEKNATPGIVGSMQKQLARAQIHLTMFAAHLWPNSGYETGNMCSLTWWHSIGDYKPARSLRKVSIPLFLAHGERDTNTPVESAEALVEYFKRIGKRNLSYHSYKNCDHYFQDSDGKSHWDEVTHDLMQWLEPILNNTT